MAEYIDRDELLKELCTVSAPTPSESWIVEKCIQKVNEQPTADVVPKSEVEKLKIAYEGSQKAIKGLTEMIIEKNEELAKLETHLELHHGERSLNNLIAEEKAEVARKIFAEIEKIATAEGAYDYVSIQEIAELKKKYIQQECPKCKHFVGCEKANWVRCCEEYEEDSK